MQATRQSHGGPGMEMREARDWTVEGREGWNVEGEREGGREGGIDGDSLQKPLEFLPIHVSTLKCKCMEM